MVDIIIFGTGHSAEMFVNQLDKNQTNIVAFLDNNSDKVGKYFYEKLIYDPNDISLLSYDYIIIASQFLTTIYSQLLDLDIQAEKIIPIYYEMLLKQHEQRYEKILGSLLYYKDNNRIINKISLISVNNSGCNCKALAHYTPIDVQDKFKINLLAQNEVDDENSDVVVNTHRNTSVRTNKINIELWHGFPIKGMFRMDRNRNPEDTGPFENWKYAHGIASYSPLFTTILNACFPTTIDQFHITGMPRNDHLYHSEGLKHLKRLLPEMKEDSFKICYMPTYRVRKSYSTKELCEGKRPWSQLFDFPDFNESLFFDFLEKNNITLVLKLHTVEEERFSELVKEMLGGRVFLVSNKMLEESQLDMYETLNAFDALITDYSSVYFDYLLLDRPIIFTPTDLEEYNQSRGFLLEPYSFWTPGDHAITLSDFFRAIMDAKNNPNKNFQQRKMIRDLVHTYQDGDSSRRVWNMIEKILENGRA
ncbi:CDP-glycerol glycerophosphotransferase family protein [Paenibacillus dendritiformis]|uniref:Glycosyl/glycerophosphate transferase n=1 Tax=Paenibacillus dendritiformis C454 TaxID=1131935 RepID=H3S9T5_9BACL|nr:CDP-glycerol glycerophosphotransferase family protein [Paenibacillus dendritiformis]EHQ64203.1 glycosyl/glycerophosphate transferase [Paenibacillus dendritiformis C454]CAH8767392.1 CDP-glycerol glycerophosphotransferase family protein [Paenibacillus dendritiformis]